MLGKLIEKLRPTKHSSNRLMNAYKRLPVHFSRGEGARLWDDAGKEYIDLIGGIAVTFLGHSHPRISQAISLQASTLIHTSNCFHITHQEELGKKFCAISGMDRVFFTNSGAEANETAIKITRLYARKRNIEKPVVITMEKAFHGRTMATISASGNTAIQTGFEPLVEQFIHVPYNDIEAVKAHNDNLGVVAVMLEPIQGEGGIIVPEPSYLKALRELCDQNKWLLITDEIQTGVGRTGRWFAHQYADITPDILCSAKALGNGFPVGACAAKGQAADLISPGSHGTTYGGNPLACRVALEVISTIEEENLLERAAELGKLFKNQLNQHLGTTDKVREIRGQGLMIGIEMDKVYPELDLKLLNAGVVVNVTAKGSVIRILPSVLISEAQIKQASETIADVVSTL